MHNYEIAQNAVDDALRQSAEHGWPEEDTLRKLIVCSIALHAKATGSANTRSMLEFELSNLSGTADFDFVRSR